MIKPKLADFVTRVNYRDPKALKCLTKLEVNAGKKLGKAEKMIDSIRPFLADEIGMTPNERNTFTRLVRKVRQTFNPEKHDRVMVQKGSLINGNGTALFIENKAHKQFRSRGGLYLLSNICNEQNVTNLGKLTPESKKIFKRVSKNIISYTYRKGMDKFAEAMKGLLNSYSYIKVLKKKPVNLSRRQSKMLENNFIQLSVFEQPK